MEDRKDAVLYVSYDGMLEPLGQSQVLRYLERLSRQHKIILMSYEKPEDWRDNEKREVLWEAMNAFGIKWLPLKYHKSPSGLATVFDILQGILVGSWVLVRHHVKIVHARSYVDAVVALTLKKVFGTKFIFDMRGFWADERVDGGLWSADGRMYRVAKWFERSFLLNADCVVSLTHAAVDEMSSFPYLKGKLPDFHVITTCADLKLFTPRSDENDSQRSGSPFTLGYVGSVGVWYLFDETLHCFQLLLERMPNAQLHILNRGGHAYILERIASHKIDPDSVTIESADHLGVAQAIQRMDAGVFFIKPVYSKMASAPTKLGEFLGCGVPILSNSGVGDMATILESEKVGIIVSRFDDASMNVAIDQLLLLTKQKNIKEKCREAAIQYFSLVDGVRAYDEIYTSITDDCNDF